MREAFAVIAAIGTESGQAPGWILLFAAGQGEVEGVGKYLVDEQGFNAISKQFVARGNDLVIDYEHQTLGEGQAPAAGWIKELKWDPAKGIMARVEWTAQASAYIAAREYRYFSPVFFISKQDGRLLFLHSVALTNAPRTNHLTPILAKLGADAPKEAGNMDWFKKLFAALGLADGASGDDVLAAVAKLSSQDKPVVAKEVLDALGLKDGDGVSAVVASVHALRQGADGAPALAARLQALEAELAGGKAVAAVAKATAAGKITPAQTDWATEYAKRDLAGFELFVVKAPVVVPVQPLPGGGPQGDTAAVDAATLAVAKLMGNSAEDIKKYGGEAA